MNRAPLIWENGKPKLAGHRIKVNKSSHLSSHSCLDCGKRVYRTSKRCTVCAKNK
jgi:hypothetical protein